MGLKIRVTPTLDVERAAQKHVQKQMQSHLGAQILGLPSGVKPWLRDQCGQCDAEYWEPEGRRSYYCPDCQRRNEQQREAEHQARMLAIARGEPVTV